ncbi:MAG: hypothetical protein AAB930_03415 [Patescibacteria group bacterium]
MEKETGKVIHFYDKARVAVLSLTGGALAVGDTVKFVKGDAEHTEKIESMQVEHESVESVQRGGEVAVKISATIKTGAVVYKVG